MNRVRLLSDQVANQIAAGEVVERPASVVKELVENSLDAKATRITIEIQAGGRSLIRVTDDGFGMSRDDALLCLERHATSKIKLAEDLAAISTMGFRGEALPSIASVSRFTLTTRERETDSPEGTQIVINGGKILEVKAAGSAPGTAIEVRQLFFNLPARRKFLRTEETEAAHIQHYLTLAALAFPEVAFTFQKDGRTIWQLPAAKSGEEISQRLSALRERLRSLWGDQQKLLTVDFVTELAEPGDQDSESSHATGRTSLLRLWGFIGAPGVSRSTREDQHLFVNRRPVENRGLNFALMEGYHTALMKGRYPVGCLFLEISPAAVDVNIHPSKREVKFHREGDVRRLVAQAIRETLLRFHSVAPASRPEIGPQEVEAPRQQANLPVPSAPHPEIEQSALPHFPPALKPRSDPADPIASALQPALRMGFRPASAESFPAPGNIATAASQRNPGENRPPPVMSGQFAAPVPLLHVPLRLVGVIGRLYVVLESDRGLVLLDQHAAHERILFEQMLNRLEQ
jgi:DNA mismatch repair protein MutL